MNINTLKSFNIDISKTISADSRIKFFLSFFKKSFLKYYHSSNETENYYTNIIIFDEQINDVINSYSFPISKNDWDNYNEKGVSEIRMFYDNCNDIIILVRDNIGQTKKIFEIIYYKNLLKEPSDDKILSESRLCNKYFDNNSLKIIEKVEGKVSFEFMNVKTNSSEIFSIWNISDEDYSDAIEGSPFDEITINEEKYYRLDENEIADEEIKKFTNNNSYYLPYKFFTEEEWKIINIRFPSKYFRNSLDYAFNKIATKYNFEKQPNQIDKDAIIKEIEQTFIEDKEIYVEPEHNYNAKDWLKDAAGTSDPDVMNDVYWNLD